MPTYSYTCEKCNSAFELYSSIREYVAEPKCPHCASKKTSRNYIQDVSTLSASVKKADSELKSLGDLANRNSERMSDDQKQALHLKHNAYKETESTKELPKGMSRIQKPKNKIKWR